MNIYAHLSAPGSKGAEAVIISASWKSLSFAEEDKIMRNSNFRAIAMLLAAAKQYKGELFPSLRYPIGVFNDPSILILGEGFAICDQ